MPVLLAAMLATMLALSAGGAPAQTAAAQPTPGDVAAAIREAVKLQPATLLEGAELAPLRATSGPQLGDAMTCLRLAGTPPVYIAVFFDHGKVLSYRRAVAYDRCGGEEPYAALAPRRAAAGPGRAGARRRLFHSQ